MSNVADELASIPFLRRCPSRDLQTCAPLWAQLPLHPGQSLWIQGTVVDEVGILLVGELSAEVDGTEVGRVLAGELLGEASAFFAGTMRSATLRARTPAEVLVLPTASLRTLRWQRSAVYEALLGQALLTLSRRVRATDARIAQVVEGDHAAPARTEPSALVRLWKALRPGGPAGPLPPLEPLLRRQPGLATADGEVIAALAQSFVPESFSEGHILFLEGETGSAAYLLAEGQVDVLRHVRGDRAERLAGVAPGGLLGVNTLVEKGARTASCVAATPGWLYRIDMEANDKLRGEPRLAWRESMLGALGTQLRGANTALQRAVRIKAHSKATPGVPATGASGKRPGAKRPDVKTPDVKNSESVFQDLLRASGYLEVLPASETDLEQVEVVITEDDARNRRRRL